MKNTFGAIILSGGKSERMNYPKAFLEIDGVTFLKKLIDIYKEMLSEIVVVLNDELSQEKWKNFSDTIDTECKIVLNHHSEKGKFYSLQLGVKKITSEYCFIQNVDNPFVSSFTLNSLMKNKNPNGITVPMHNGKGGHPILVSKNVIEKISLTEDTKQHLKDFYWSFSIKTAEMGNDSVLMNINTLEEYEKFVAIKS
ncbi:MAG: NTP transferase domain-containing protein [Bacteroidetes bacterium]|nr:NTP transferase domain-containing protein [Bacteroidota bacterium]